MLRRAARNLVTVVIGIVILGVASSCSWVSGWFDDDDTTDPTAVSVFDAEVGDCLVAPEKVEAQLSDLMAVPCDVPHQQELYAIVAYPSDDDSDNFPGNAALSKYAKGACAQAFSGYVGIAYPDSGLWMTYLMPSARSWQKSKDRSILCFVTTTAGGSLTKSVQGSKL